jgi:uncharacterized protein YjbI with pentapeptide repeats
MRFPEKTLWLRLLATALLAFSGPLLHAQANLRINLTRTNGLVVVSWRADTLVPRPGNAVFANYKIVTSSNLVDWRVVGPTIFGLDFANAEVRREFPPSELSFFVKVESVINYSGLDIIRAALSDGNFERATFVGCDFFGSILDRANLQDANLQAADFRESSLIDANLRNADLRGATFSAANLANANLRGAIARFTDFTDSNLSGADFEGADLRFTSLLGAQIDFIGLRHTIIDDDTLLAPRTRLIWDLVNDKKVGATISNQVLTISNLRGADLRNTRWLTTDLRGSDLREVNLGGANLIGARLDFVDFRQTLANESTVLPVKWRLVLQINNGDFSGAVLSGRELSNASFVEARLAGANLSGANLQLTTLIRANLKSANLRNARLRQADATGANFENADLTGADLSLVDLTDANLLGADINGANLTSAIFENTTMPDGTIR